ncbi:hypothetical protein [Variovorax sp. OV329]|uniref:hypothetical protein n=1 Tax=Variovorax sp. OV329 TaxID=1882825 RepID=UPI0008F1A872|nr:hypothetical protein [Variovorax sp. OV329]SFM20626.1 hypothetical protein SAMN05444747_103322 [Variovorax sp. OV329]
MSYRRRQVWLQTAHMHLEKLQVLRVSYEQTRGEYFRVHRALVARLEAAVDGCGPWPDAAEYALVAALGRKMLSALREYLDCSNVRHTSVRSVEEKMQLIQRLSANERLWQPSPEHWLEMQVIAGFLRDDGQ